MTIVVGLFAPQMFQWEGLFLCFGEVLRLLSGRFGRRWHHVAGQWQRGNTDPDVRGGSICAGVITDKTVLSIRCTCGWAPRPARWRSNSAWKPVRSVCFYCRQTPGRIFQFSACIHILPLLCRFTSSTCAQKTQSIPENCGWSERETSPTASHDASTPGALSKLPPLKPIRTRKDAHVVPWCPPCLIWLTPTFPPPNRAETEMAWILCRIKVWKHLFRLKEECTDDFI